MKNVIVSLVALAGVAAVANAQVTQEPIGATLRYQVSVDGGPWGNSAVISAGQRVEWRATVSYTGSLAPVALGQIFYQPVFSNVDNVGAGAAVDMLGAWRNGGISGQGNTTLAQGLLTAAEGNSTAQLADYGRVRYGFTSRSTTAGNSGALTGIRHSAGSAGAPAGEFIRVAGSNNTQWYPSNIPNGSTELNNRILWGVVADNNAANNTWFTTGTTDVTIFRQAFIASNETPVGTDRVVTLTSEAATLRRTDGGSGINDTRFMTWALNGEGGATASVRVGVEYIPATITILVPAPGVAALAGMGGLLMARRRRA